MKTSYRTGVLVTLASLFFMLMANDAMAGTGGTEFNTVWTLLTGWV